MGVEFQSAQYMPNVTHANRALVEEDSRQFYAQSYPHVNYHGFMGFEPSNETGEIGVHPRSEQPFYFSVHLIEPVEGNEKAIDLDLYSSRIQHDTLLQAISTWKPALTERLKLVQDTDPYAFSVILHHPGVPTSFRQTDDNVPAGVSLMVVRIPDLIRRAASSSAEGRSVFIYDSTHVDQSPVFLGGADTCAIKGFKAREEVSLAQLQSSHDMIEIDNIRIADRQWTIAVVPLPGTYEADLVFVILGGVIIFMATILLIIWSYTNMTKSAKFVQMKATAEAEKAAIILETAKKQAISERELNGKLLLAKSMATNDPICYWKTDIFSHFVDLQIL